MAPTHNRPSHHLHQHAARLEYESAEEYALAMIIQGISKRQTSGDPISIAELVPAPQRGLAQPPPPPPLSPGNPLADPKATLIVAAVVVGLAATLVVLSLTRFLYNRAGWAKGHVAWASSKIRPRVRDKALFWKKKEQNLGGGGEKAVESNSTRKVHKDFDDKTWGTPTPSKSESPNIPDLPAIIERWHTVDLEDNDDDDFESVLPATSVSAALAGHKKQAQLETINEDSQEDIYARYGPDFTKSRWRSEEDEDILTMMTLRAAMSSVERRDGKVRNRTRQGSDASNTTTASSASTQPDLETFDDNSTASSMTSLSHAVHGDQSSDEEGADEGDDVELELETAQVVQARRVETKSIEVKRGVWRTSKDPRDANNTKIFEQMPTVVISGPVDVNIDIDITDAASSSSLPYLTSASSSQLLHPSSAPSFLSTYPSASTVSTSASIDLADFPVPPPHEDEEEYFSVTASISAASELDSEKGEVMSVAKLKRMSVPPFLVLRRGGGQLCRRDSVVVG